ncbi:thioesterase family protein [Nonomuraea sp. NPDC046802]|uniref:thioesterase family protein n=1 Tax=Nonomuraea sp. NPDC046802 TaxID=3154919 RepID=UPI0033DE554D
MVDLEADSAITDVGEGRYTATLSPDWNVWGPVGGYVASVALRAAGAATTLRRPASLSCQFLHAAQFDQVELVVEPLRASRRAEALRVTMTQAGKTVLHATVWAAAESLDGPSLPLAAAPQAPPPEELPTMEERMAEWGQTSLPHLFHSDTRPVSWLERVSDQFGEPNQRGWMRLRKGRVFDDDPWLDAARSVLYSDIVAFPSVMLASPDGLPPYVAPTMELQVIFHDTAPESEWLLVDGHASALKHGLASGRAAIWAQDGRLLATGAQQMLCRMFG